MQILGFVGQRMNFNANKSLATKAGSKVWPIKEHCQSPKPKSPHICSLSRLVISKKKVIRTQHRGLSSEETTLDDLVSNFPFYLDYKHLKIMGIHHSKQVTILNLLHQSEQRRVES